MKRITTLMVLTAWSLLSGIGSSSAEWSASGGVEYFRWKERPAPGVKETGPRLAAGLNWTQDTESGWLGAYRGKLYGGRVDYTGALLFAPAVPVGGTTKYAGITNEAQAIYRYPGSAYQVEYVAGLGWDYWRRTLPGSHEREDYNIVFLRLGVDLNSRTTQGWYGGGGVKYPLYTRENAHFTDVGFDQNPALRPGKDMSLYAQLGHRLKKNWDLIGYYDSFRFSQSNVVAPVTASRLFPGRTFAVSQPKSSMDVFGLKLQYEF